MVENAFGVLFLAALAGPVLAVVVGVIMLAWPVRKARRTFVAARHASAHS
jgi:hypothetical protein